MPPKKAKKAAAAADDDDVILDGTVVAIHNPVAYTQAALKKIVVELGGKFATTITKAATHLITSQDEVNADAPKVKQAVAAGIHLVSEDWLIESQNNSARQKEEDYALVKAGAGAGDASATAGTDAPAAGSKRKGRSAKAGASSSNDADPAAAASSAPAPAPAPAKGRGGKKAKADAADTAPTAAPAAAAAAAAADPAPAPEKRVQVARAGNVPVDHVCKIAGAEVIMQDGVPIACTLNQVNITGGNNNNKFYIIQALEKNGSFWVFTRWGRVGEDGQNACASCGSKDAAIAGFEKKFREKTGNIWANRASFKAQSGKYTLIEIDYGEEEQVKAKAETKVARAPVDRKESTLSPAVQNLIRLIFDMKMMTSALVQMEYDIEKMPLGKLKKSTILRGYGVLQEIDNAIQRKETHKLGELSSQFYTLIPHSYSRTTRPPVINSSELLKTKMSMLEALADIEIATTLISESEESDSDASILDLNYAKLKCKIHQVEDPEVLKLVNLYVQNTYADRKKPKIVNVYELDREGEAARFAAAKSLGNRMMLWHGSRLTNFVGIISQGLRIAPPEAPVSGYRFGKGVYFADMMSLSARYCRTSGNSEFCMLLGDVALGNPAPLPRDEFMTKAKPGYHSSHALGTVHPDPSHAANKDGCVWPVGPIVSSGNTGVSCHENQFVIYDVAQCQLKYLLHLSLHD